MSNERDPTEEMVLAGIAAANRTMPYVSGAQCVAAIWKAMQAANSQAMPQGLEEWVERNKLLSLDAAVEFVVTVEDLRAYLSGMAIVPQGVEDAYQALQNELIQIQATIESFATPAAALSALIDWHVSVATDPRVNGGMAIVPVEASTEITFEIRGEKIVFCKDGVYFALTKEQIPSMHAAMLAATKEKGE